jgi:hypothetical protein
MYSSKYTSGFSGPAASHPDAPPSPRHEDNVRQAPANFEGNHEEFLNAGCTRRWHIDCSIPPQEAISNGTRLTLVSRFTIHDSRFLEADEQSTISHWAHA